MRKIFVLLIAAFVSGFSVMAQEAVPATVLPEKPKDEWLRIKLPACGIFIGSGIYNMQADYLTVSGRVHTCWVPQSYSPIEMLDKIIADNQGNLAQYWGGTGSSPITAARHYALEDLGISPPQPDWENKKNLLSYEWEELRKHHSRNGAGILKFVKAAADKGIYTVIIYAGANPEWSKQLGSVGDYYLGYDFGECFAFGLDSGTTRGKDLKTLTLQDIADDLLKRVRGQLKWREQNGWGRTMVTSASFHIDYEIVAGIEVPLMEDFAFSHLNMSSSLSRGLYKQHKLPIWGSHMAHEHYSWIPYANPHKFDLLRAAMQIKYMSGCKMIINESGNWFLQAQLCTDSPMFETPRVELGNIGNRDPLKVAEKVAEARKSYPRINYDSETCHKYRKVISDFYDFVKKNGTPEGQPEVTLAIAKGNLDLCAHEFNPNLAVAGAYALADQDVAWFEGAPERGWEIVKKVFYPRRPVLAPHHNRFLSGTPYGMVDIVSFAEDKISADFLANNYKALLFSGWNSCSEKQYGILKDYVERGGILFISIPQLSTSKTRNHNNYKAADLVNGGDFSDLCGVKVKGPGNRFYWATSPFVEPKNPLGFQFPRRFGIFATKLGNIEITDPNAEVLAADDEEMYPFLIRRRCGKGEVFFLNSWAYPGALDIDEGPGGTLDSKGLVGAVYEYIAKLSRGNVWITDDREKPGADCEYVAYSYFPDAAKICLLNVDFDKSRKFYLHRFGTTEQIELAPGEFRTIEAKNIR